MSERTEAAFMRWLRRKPLTRRERIHRLLNARGITLSSAQVPSRHDREAAKASYRRALGRRGHE